MLMYCKDALKKSEPHSIEAFGPVNTVMSYKNADEAIELAKMGKGSLVGSVFTGSDSLQNKLYSLCLHARKNGDYQ